MRNKESEENKLEEVTRAMNIPCTLSLGDIGISFEQLQRIHEGAIIQFETLPELQLTLYIGSAPFAEAVGTFEGGKAEVVIQKLLGFPENSGNQAEVCKQLFF